MLKDGNKSWFGSLTLFKIDISFSTSFFLLNKKDFIGNQKDYTVKPRTLQRGRQK